MIADDIMQCYPYGHPTREALFQEQMRRANVVELLSRDTYTKRKAMKVKRTPSGIPRPTPEQVAESKRLEEEWFGEFLRITGGIDDWFLTYMEVV